MAIFKKADADKLADRTLNAQYNKLIKNFNKLADENKSSYIALVSYITDYTLMRLKAEKFIVEQFEEGSYKKYRISWDVKIEGI